MKILIIRLSSLGDIILTQPLCALLHKHYPEAELHYLCKPEYAALVACFGLPINTIEYSKSLSWHLSLLRLRYDLVLDLHGKFNSYLAANLVRAKQKSLYDKKRNLRKAIVSHKTSTAIDSTVSLYCTALKKLGIRDAWDNPALIPTRQRKPKTQGQAPKIACFPGATHYTKRWPIEYWRALIASMPECSFTLLGGGGDKVLAKEICADGTVNCSDQTAKFNLSELVDELQDYDLVLSGDTGPMHMAAALALPQIALFGGTHPRLGFKPLNPKAQILSADLDCQPCSLHGLKACPQGHFKCMQSLSPQILSRQIEELLS